MDMRWIEVNGARFRYEHHRRDAPTIVLLHEMGGSFESYDGVMARLGKRWSVLRYDQRGAGLSDRVAGPLSVDTPAADLKALLDGLAIAGPVAVVGTAVGAAVAIRFVSHYPQKVSALALLAPSTGLIPERYTATMEKIEKLERHGGQAAPAAAASIFPDRDEASRRRPDPASYAATWRMLVDLDLEADFARIACPTLVAAGVKDADRPPDHVAQVAGKIPGARFMILDTGHVMAIDTPDLVATTLTAFLDDVGFQ